MSAGIVVKQRPDGRALLAWLLDPVHYAENLLSAEGRPLALDRWQRDFLRDRSKFISILKARRVGGSWAMALKMFIRSQTNAHYYGTFVSLNLEEAAGKIEYALRLHEALPPRFRKKLKACSKTELAFEDARGRRAVLKSLASRAPRGKGGDVGISELPHCLNASAVYEGALHVTSRSPRSRLVVESTPIGKAGVFYDLCRGRYPQFARYEVPWWHCSALCADVEKAIKEAPSLPTRDRVRLFGSPSMRAIYASMGEEAFRQESELAFIESAESAFPLDVLHRNVSPDYGAGDGADLKFLSLKKPPAPDDWRWLEKNRAGQLVAGFDVGRTRDDSCLFVIDIAGGKCEARMMVRLSETDFATQEHTLSEALRHGVARLVIDSTGMGLPLAERLEARHGSAVTPLHFTPAVKLRLVSGLRLLLMEGRLRLPLERSLMEELGAVERRVSGSGGVLFATGRVNGSHADAAWGLLLACYAHDGAAPRAVHYEPVVTRNNKWRW